MSAMMAMGPCYSCGQTFGFDPELVCSIVVCSECDMPADMHEPGCQRVGELQRRAVCLACVNRVNRLAPGKFSVRPGAYPLDRE